MGQDALEQVPVTYNRAATELVQARRHLEDTADCLRLALDIFERLPEQDGIAHRHLRSLREALWRLEDARQVLRGAEGT